tara:strand:- start:82 stop:612 length:531 start_codon:yes stop_codon:yes gene_type:complete
VRFAVLILFLASPATADWKVDFSRRLPELKTRTTAEQEPSAQDAGFFKDLFKSSSPTQEVVILNTDQGFVPAVVRLKQGQPYKLHIVNVNESNKNVSFILSSFSEHHSTYFGKVKTFHVNPKRDGIYEFQCPETAAQGRLVVYGDQPSTPDRQMIPVEQQPLKSENDVEVRMPASY